MDDNGVLNRSPLSRLSKRDYDFHTTTVVTNYLVGVGAVRVAQENPNRVGLMIHNPSNIDMDLAPTPGVLPGAGVILSARGGTFSMSQEEDGEGVGYELWMINAVGNGTIIVWEVLVV